MPKTSDHTPQNQNDQPFPDHPDLHKSPREVMDKSLRRLMDHVGLGDVPLSALGGNHPMEPAPEGSPLPELPVRGGLPPLPKDEPSARHPRSPMTRRQEFRATLEKNLPPAPVSAPQEATDPDPIELALRMKSFMWDKELTLSEAARQLGRSRAYVRNHLALLKMPYVIQEHVRTGRLCEGHARIIGRMRDPEAIARLVIARQLSVRETEIMGRRLRNLGPDGMLASETAIPNTKFVEDLIEAALGMKARVKDRAGRGKIEIHYESTRQCNELVNGLCRVFGGLIGD